MDLPKTSKVWTIPLDPTTTAEALHYQKRIRAADRLPEGVHDDLMFPVGQRWRRQLSARR